MHDGQSPKTQNRQSGKSSRRVVIILTLVVLGMFGFGFAMVPLYNVLCKAIGINGKPGGPAAAYTGAIDSQRTITVSFVATMNAQLPWKFYPLVTQITVHPGETKRIAFFAENLSDHTMTIQAIPSITPSDAARYLKKTECFCFTQQTLKSGEVRDMPLIFHLDPELPKDIKGLTLSYTLFDAGRFQHTPPAKNAGRL